MCATITGCATKVHEDYGQYLQNNSGVLSIPKINYAFGYTASLFTTEHKLIVRSWMAGIANTWEIRFYDILKATLASSDVQNSIDIHPYQINDNNKISFNLLSYSFNNTKATIKLNIDTSLHEGEKLSKTYTGTGNTQRGKMYWGSGFAMKNAIQQSSKVAMDQIISNYFNDLMIATNANEEK
jgi:hypothetical protein